MAAYTRRVPQPMDSLKVIRAIFTKKQYMLQGRAFRNDATT